jgi:hypothetical protein
MIETLVEPAAEGALADCGLMLKLEQVGTALPDCVTLNVLPAMLTLDER